MIQAKNVNEKLLKIEALAKNLGISLPPFRPAVEGVTAIEEHISHILDTLLAALEEAANKPLKNIRFNWVDDEVASINCPICKKELIVSIYPDSPKECCGTKYVLKQQNWVEVIR